MAVVCSMFEELDQLSVMHRHTCSIKIEKGMLSHSASVGVPFSQQKIFHDKEQEAEAHNRCGFVEEMGKQLRSVLQIWSSEDCQ
jgi:hypothetical protein